MTKALIMKASIVLGAFLVIIGVSYGISVVFDNDQEPSLENPDEIYVSMGDLDITNQELYEIMMQVDGYNFLLDYVDRIIVDDFLNNITDEEVEEQKMYEIYNTRDEDIIAEIQADPELNQEYLDLFEQRLVTRGYNINNEGDVRAFTELTIARRNFVEDYVINEDTTGEFEFTQQDIIDYYNENTKGDVCALQIRFSTAAEANDVFNHFNLVANYEGGWGLYTGSGDLEDIAKEDLDETNTTELSDDEVFEQFVLLYNFMNPNAEQLGQSVTKDTYCNDSAAQDTLVFEDYVKESQAASQIATFLFDTLDTEGTDGEAYSNNIRGFGDFQVMAYKVSQEDVPEYSELSSIEKFDVLEDMYSFKLTPNFINTVLAKVHADMDFEIYQKELKLKHEYTTTVTFDNTGSEDYLATFGDETVTPNDLFTYMENSIGAFYAMEYAKTAKLIYSDYYVDLYGNSRDYLDNSSDLMKDYRDNLRGMKTAFGVGEYASYGFSPDTYTWQEFIYVAFSASSEANLIEQLYVIGSLSPYYIYPSIEVERGQDFVENQQNEYYDVYPTHLLMYIDFDWTYSPDDFDEYIDSLSSSELTEYETLKAQFEDLINAKLAEDYTYEDIIEEYEAAPLYDTDNEYYAYKAYGFIIKTEDITMGEGQEKTSVNNRNDESLDEAFAERLKALYDSYILPANIDENQYVDDQLTRSSFGLHFITVSKGDNFDFPDATYTASDDTDDEFDSSIYNDNELPTTEQIEAYVQLRYEGATNQNTEGLALPTDVYRAVHILFGPVYDAYMSQTGLSVRVLDELLDENITFTTDQADQVKVLEDLLEVLYIINFPEEFDHPTQD